MLSRGNCWLNVEGIAEAIPLTGGDCILLARDTSIVMRDSPRTSPKSTFREIAAKAKSNVAHCGGGGAPTTIVCGSLSFDRASLKPITQLLPSFILIRADQARTFALHNTMQALASEMADQVPGSEIVATRLAEVLFIQVLRAYIASEPERKQGWLRAVFDPQIGTALTAFHDQCGCAMDSRVSVRSSGRVSLRIRSALQRPARTNTAGIRNRVADAEGDAVTRTA